MLSVLSERLAANDIAAKFTDKAINRISEIGFDPTFGARPLRRAIQSDIEDMIAEKMLAGEIKMGDSIKIDFSKDAFVVKK